MSFGEKFKVLLDAKGENYETVSLAIGYNSKANITYLINRKTLPPQDKLDNICEYFKVPRSYFLEDSTTLSQFRQPDTEYKREDRTIPLYENESADATVVDSIELPLGYIGGFAVIIGDDRLEQIKIPAGSTVFLTRKFTLSSKHRVLVKQGENRFFATYEKREKDAVIIPADSKMPLIVLDKKSKPKTEIYAVVTHILISE